MIELYTASTPNGWKVSIALEEMALPYSVRPIALSKGEQKEEWYLTLNPNGRIPTIVDHDNGDFAVFESGASVEGLSHLQRWLAAIKARPAVERGRAVPERLDLGTTKEAFIKGAQIAIVGHEDKGVGFTPEENIRVKRPTFWRSGVAD